jgi:hypothetical protein
VYVKDDRNDRQYLLSELSDGDPDSRYNSQLLKTTVYLVQVNIVEQTRPVIAYGDCLALLILAKTETARVDGEIEALHSRWQTFLETLKDKDGGTLRPCTLCENNIRDVVFMPCGHLGACRACADEWKSRNDTCPYCRTPVESIDSVRQHLTDLTEKTKLPFQQAAHLATRDIFGLLAELKSVAALKNLG